MTKKRENYLDVLRGFVMFVTIIGHILGAIMTLDYYDNYYNIINPIYLSIYLFHMPFFLAISGYVENFKKDEESSFKSKFINNFFSLMIPYFLFHWILITINLVLNNNDFDIINYFSIIYKPLSNLWFIYALFCFKLIEPLLYKLVKKDLYVTLIWLFLFMISILLFNGNSNNIIELSFSYGISYHIGFLIGKINYKKINYLLLIFIELLSAFIYYKINPLIGKTIFGISLFILLLHISKKYNLKNNILEFIGRNTMIFFIIDGFTGVPVIQIIWNILHIKNIVIVFLLVLFVKIIASYITIYLCKCSKFIRSFFYPSILLKNKS